VGPLMLQDDVHLMAVLMSAKNGVFPFTRMVHIYAL